MKKSEASRSNTTNLPFPDSLFRDASAPIEERIADLLQRMTVDEKLAQLCSDLPMALFAGTEPEKLKEKYPNGLGRFTQYSTLGLVSPHQIAKITNAIQRYFCEHTRLGIPVMPQAENLCGYPASGGTLFPAMINAGATFDPELVGRMSRIISDETRAVGIRQCLSPVMDLARDPRWGRVYETFGEDPYLVSQMSVAYVQEMQKNKTDGVLATAKHFLGYSETQAGLNTAATHLTDRELYEYFGTPFEASIKDADLAAIMTSYSEIDGIPCGANPKIVRKLLRQDMGFDGLVVSDGGAVWKLFDTFHVAVTYDEAGLLGIKGGMETEMPIGGSYKKLGQYLENGELDISLIDQAVRHVLKSKFEAGLFENPYVVESEVEASMTSAEKQQLSLELAEQSIILLENKDNRLPLACELKLAVIGPHGGEVRPSISGYTYPTYIEMYAGLFGARNKDITFHGIADEQRKVDVGAGDINNETLSMASIMAGSVNIENLLRHELQGTPVADELAADFEVGYARGCEIMGGDEKGFAEAIEAAKAGDVVIMTLGGNCGWTGTTGGEGKDRQSIGLPGLQQKLLDAVAAVGKDIVLVLYGPGPYAPDYPANVKAVLYAGLPGTHGGKALANILSGKTNPSARLSITVPRNSGQVPMFHYHKPASGPAKVEGQGDGFASAIFSGGYTDGPDTPLYPFGYGLGYASFALSDFAAASDRVETDGVIELSCTIQNTSSIGGSEVIQIYYRDMEARVTRPVRQLCAFRKVHLAAGEKRRVVFRLSTAQLGFYNEDMEFVVEPGNMRFMLGQSSDHIVSSVNVVLTGAKQNLMGRRSYSCESAELSPDRED